MSQTQRIENVLTKNRDYPGITVAALASKARVPVENVSKRIYDLRQEGLNIYTNYRKYRGSKKLYYRLHA